MFPFARIKIGMGPESGAHRPFLELSNGRLKERANIAHDCVSTGRCNAHFAVREQEFGECHAETEILGMTLSA